MLNMSLMHTCTSKISPPPAAPWNARPTMRANIVFAVAQTAEETKKHASARSTISFRPHMSESFAQIGPDAAFASRNAPPIQVYPAEELRSLEIVGAAVDTMVASSAATNRDSWRVAC